jgi:type I restriction enzyme S subunit
MSGFSWQLPPSWTWSVASEVSDIVGGSTPSTTDSRNFCTPGTGIAWLTPADLSGYKAKTIARGARDITAKGLRESGVSLMPAGTVLFSSRAPVGYVAVAREPLTTNQGFKSFVLSEVMDPDFLYYYLQRARGLIEGLASGTTFKEISGAKARTIPIPVAPREEQRRIAEALDTALPRLDAAVASLEAAQRKLKAYRASVLKAAVEGRLVPTEATLARKEGRSYEPGDVLLERLLKERRRRWEEGAVAKFEAAGRAPTNDDWKARYKEPHSPDTADLPGLPEGWCWATAEQLCEFITKGTTPAHDAMTEGTGEVPYVKVYNLTFDGTLNFEQAPTFVNRATHTNVLARSICHSGDVLMNLVGPPLGKVSLLPAQFPEWNINQAIARYRLIDSTLSLYFVHVLLESRALKWAMARTKTTAGQVNLTLEIARDIPIPLPPRDEQARILNEIGRQLSDGAAVNEAARANQQRCRRLRQAILKWSFEGRLVDQDPADEPADALLARIRTDRATAQPAKPKPQRSRKLKAAS